MNTRLLGFFSGFPTRHFPTDIVSRLREELSVRESLVFVSAWPSEYEQNDSDSTGLQCLELLADPDLLQQQCATRPGR